MEPYIVRMGWLSSCAKGAFHRPPNHDCGCPWPPQGRPQCLCGPFLHLQSSRARGCDLPSFASMLTTTLIQDVWAAAGAGHRLFGCCPEPPNQYYLSLETPGHLNKSKKSPTHSRKHFLKHILQNAGHPHNLQFLKRRPPNISVDSSNKFLKILDTR